MTSPLPVRATARRTVVRAGVTAAWVTPVVIAAGAAPAFAASDDTTLLPVLGQPVRGLSADLRRTMLVVTGTITNTGAFATTALVAVLRVTASTSTRDISASTASTINGFDPPVMTSQGISQVFFSYTATTQLAAGMVVPFTPVVTLGNETDGALQLAASPGNGPTATNSIPFQ